MSQPESQERYVIKFCIKFHALKLLTDTYRDETLSRAQIHRCHNTLKDGRELVEGEECFAQSTTSKTDENVMRVKVFLNTGRTIVKLIAKEMGHLKWDVHRIILKNLHM